MDMEVVGRHALLFDDDGAAAFVNSAAPLVDWCGQLIDRYDVRHLLPHPPPPRSSSSSLHRRRRSPEPDGISRAELDRERFLDLPSPDDEEGQSAPGVAEDANVSLRAGDSYKAVGFSYGRAGGNSEDFKSAEAFSGGSSYCPPFPVPEYLLNGLLIKQGEQFERWWSFAHNRLRMVQPPTEKLHQIIATTSKFVAKHGAQSEIVLRVKQGDNPTFGFLMPDHYLHPYFRFLVDHQNLLEAQVSVETGKESIEGGSLTLLGSVYGDDDDEYEEKDADIDNSVVNEVNRPVSTSVSSASLEISPLNSKVHNKKHATLVTKASARKMVSTSGSSDVAASGKPLAPPIWSINEEDSQVNTVVEPPSSVKEVVDRIVEMVLRNGKEVEAIIVEQNKNKFPFLLSSNQYHPYYLMALRKAQKSKEFGRNVHGSQEFVKDTRMKSQLEGKLDTERKEKFKMVIGVSKKDIEEPSAKSPSQPGMSVDAATAIVMAATRGFNKGIDFTSKMLHNCSLKGGDIVSVSRMLDSKETDSAEAGLSEEQRLKAERLKRAKMFTALIKTGAKPSGDALSRALTPVPDSSLSDYSRVRERESSSACVDGKRTDAKVGSVTDTCNECSEQSSEKGSTRSKTYEEDGADVIDKHSRHSRKRHREHSSRHGKERHKHRKSHSSSRRKESKRRHNRDSSSEDEHSHRSRSHRHSSEKSYSHDLKAREYSSDIVNAEANIENMKKIEMRRSLSISEKDSKVQDATEIPDDLRAKVRAMLMATM